AEAKAKLTQQVKGGGGAGVPDATGVSAIQTVTDWRDENCAMCHQLVVDGLARVRGVGEGCPYTGINFWATMTRRAYYWSDVISDRLHVYSRRRAVAHGFLCVPFLAAGPGLLSGLRAALAGVASSAVYIGQAEPSSGGAHTGRRLACRRLRWARLVGCRSRGRPGLDQPAAVQEGGHRVRERAVRRQVQPALLPD
uniref:DUF1996 domain-containing protein n=1 Tax=Macrostomum lignano TaxID=282301 RepID=A0A1I8IUW1_9PLAT